MMGQDGEDRAPGAVRETLAECHRRIAEIDEELSRLVHRREKIVDGVRAALLERLPTEGGHGDQDGGGTGGTRPRAAGRGRRGTAPDRHPAFDPAAEPSPQVTREVQALHDRLRGFHEEIERVDVALTRLVRRRKELVTTTLMTLARRVPEAARGKATGLEPRVAMALAPW
ncbi:hypothetical protein LX15_005341 [Streptoalloteichus tenebrarius]|uniref:Uncharacterized protein n=1 Tax=Streptoalloteichus tenebrarius (strain ATCC 17920 / DSM 40477 / JCM 4838 / CBS 697.72 / NBRC 16177 / NCIMB 11028 / NRRL B-12390 / A12253. 1 / ISP 5477) TaxID=1933 RepID=A0ABT1I1F7_STRSD|nr:hypothetical protein [Streptoalloteichus tenebrarius]MCP2261615.1 hypothetical protein [Streptoalloteichus tenebrarius]BFE99384.1 hypothetical protein GCM10020241_10600 [Streptoalloteichus tenebrarius]